MKTTFEWHSEKAKSDIKKHGISFEEASSVFFDTHTLEMEDEKYSQAEQRYIVLGKSMSEHILVVIFTLRKNKIRIISARAASRKERLNYEKNN